jgi:hypothetical protein
MFKEELKEAGNPKIECVIKKAFDMIIVKIFF